jgi:hypothetical protein
MCTKAAFLLVLAAAPTTTTNAAHRLGEHCPPEQPVVSDGVCKSRLDAFVSCVQRTAAESSELSEAAKVGLRGKVEGEARRLLEAKIAIQGIGEIENQLKKGYRRESHAGAEVRIIETCARLTEAPKAASPRPSTTMRSAARVTFSTPVPGAEIEVGKGFVVSGRVSKVRRDRDLWLAHRRQRLGLAWVRQGMVGTTPAGEFRQDDWDHGDPGDLFVCALEVPRDVSKEFQTWLDTSREKNNYAGLDVNRPSIAELGCVDVRLVAHAATSSSASDSEGGLKLRRQ